MGEVSIVKLYHSTEYYNQTLGVYFDDATYATPHVKFDIDGRYVFLDAGQVAELLDQLGGMRWNRRHESGAYEVPCAECDELLTVVTRCKCDE